MAGIIEVLREYAGRGEEIRALTRPPCDALSGWEDDASVAKLNRQLVIVLSTIVDEQSTEMRVYLLNDSADHNWRLLDEYIWKILLKDEPAVVSVMAWTQMIWTLRRWADEIYAAAVRFEVPGTPVPVEGVIA